MEATRRLVVDHLVTVDVDGFRCSSDEALAWWRGLAPADRRALLLTALGSRRGLAVVGRFAVQRADGIRRRPRARPDRAEQGQDRVEVDLG